MLKFFRLMSVLSAILAPFMVEVAFSRPSLAVPNSADNKQVCHMDTTDGRIRDLSHLCSKQPKTEAPSTEAQLTEIAKADILTQNQALVSGNIDPNRKAILAAHDIRYTGFQTDLKVKNIQVQGDRATVDATEHTVLNLQVGGGDPLAPKTTEYYQDRLLTLVLENGQWKLFSNQVLNAPSPQRPEKDVPLIDKSVTPMSISDTKSENDGKSSLVAEAKDELKNLPSLKYSYTSPTTPSKSDPDSQLIAAASLNRSAIVNYAYKYWSNYNTSYRNFNNSGTQGGDCTNFVSQAVLAGGWPQVSGWYRSDSVWWYNSFNQSWTWINAHRWYLFTRNRPRASALSNVSALVPGDILQIDFDRDGYIDHSTIVTKKDSSGRVYLTYHTNNTKDKSFWDFYSAYKNANYYAWRLSSNYN